jgi:predicted transcriptional regulator of viral defense system
MEHYDQIKEIFEKNNGIVRTADITARGIHNAYLEDLCKKGVVSRIKRGMYEWIEDGTKDDLEIIHRIFPDCVVCMHSALSYYGYSDRIPDRWHLAFDRDINKKRLKINYPPVKPYYFMSHILEIGVAEEGMNSSNVRIYNRERTICDVLRYSNKMDREIVNKAIQNYLKDSDKDIRKLIMYSKKLRVYKKVQQWIGVWL